MRSQFLLLLHSMIYVIQRHSIHGMMEEENVIRPHQEIQALTYEEKKFLLAVERGDVASTGRYVKIEIWPIPLLFTLLSVYFINYTRVFGFFKNKILVK